MIEEEIKIRINPEGTDEVTDALDALDTLESKAHQVNRSTEGFIKLAADAHKTRSAMSDAAKFTKTLPAAPVRPMDMNKLMPDAIRPPAGGKRMAGISPAALPIVASFISPAIIGAVLNRYDPFLKGAAAKYFLDPKKHDPRLSEYLLGTTPGFLYAGVRTIMSKWQRPKLPPAPPPNKQLEEARRSIQRDRDAQFRKLIAWNKTPGGQLFPPHPTNMPDIYYNSHAFARDRNARAQDDWNKHTYWARKHFNRWRRPAYGAGQPGAGMKYAPGVEKGEPHWDEDWYDPTSPNMLKHIPPRGAPYPPVEQNGHRYERPPSNLEFVLGGRHRPPIMRPPESYAFLSARVAAQTDWEKFFATPPGARMPSHAPRVAYPPPTPRPTPEYEFTKSNNEILRAVMTAREGMRPPDIKAPFGATQAPEAPAYGSQGAQRRGSGQPPGNTYHITVHKIADTIQGQTVDQKSIMKLLGTIVETELPTR